MSYYVKKYISDLYFHKRKKIKINSDDDFPFKKTLTMNNVVVIINTVFN